MAQGIHGRSTRQRRRALLSRLVGLAGAAVLAGCGGGWFVAFEFGDVDFDDEHRPSVSLAADTSAARPGAQVQLIAAASSQSPIDNVEFYRFDAGAESSTLLGADGMSPYEWSDTIPLDAGDTVRYFARATDAFGLKADSAPVTITVLR
jgi:hypothetical protein